jgi:uncharacterized protein YggE
MTDNFKKYLWVAGVLIVAILTVAAWRFTDAYSSSIEPSSFRNFSVTGSGKVVSIPDVAEFSVSVLTQGGKDIASLQSQNSSKVNGAIDFVKSSGVDKKDIQTSAYSIEPRYQYFSCPANAAACPPSQIVGYTVSQTVTIKVRDFAKVGDILSGIVGKGVNSVSSLNFTMDDPNAPQTEAKAKAIQDAEERAKTLAKAGNFTLGRLLSIEDQSPIVYPTFAALNAGAGGKSAATPPTIEPGSEEVTASVTLRYEIK